MPVLERKIVHDVNTSCTHFSYSPLCPLHRHREYEIILFAQGSGKQFVGNGVADFNEGDVALIGSYVPHMHLGDSFLKNDPDGVPDIREALQLSPDIFPANMEELPDFRNISALLEKSRYGLRFYGEGLYGKIRSLFEELDHALYTERLICVFRMLDVLAKSGDIRLIATNSCDTDIAMEVNDPVNRAYAYLYRHFRDEIRLEDVARSIQINPAALCRRFKKSTDKTLFQCLNEIRTEYACKLLVHSSMTISEIGYEAGYNNIPYFIQQFKKQTGQTPAEYRKLIRLK